MKKMEKERWKEEMEESEWVGDPREGGDSVGRGRRKIFLMSKDFQVLTQNGGRPFKSAC